VTQSTMAIAVSYTRTQIALHWTIAALVIFQILFHGGIKSVWFDRMDGTVPNEPTPNLHIVIGLAIFALVIWRLWLRFARGVPPLPEDEHPALKALATAVHWLFYGLLILMPISGVAAWFAGLSQPATAHSLFEKALIALVVLHVVGALTQHFWFRSDVLRRMLGLA
jgi:cytochrome b561